jgi:chromosome segregation ATPase
MARSGERQALAEAIAAHQALLDRLQRLQAAEPKASNQWYALDRVVDEAQQRFEEAKERAPRSRVNILLGELSAPEEDVDELLEAVGKARRAVAIAESTLREVRSEITRTAEAIHLSEFRRRDAIAAVIRTEPALHKLAERFDRARGEAAEIGEVFNAIGPNRLPDEPQWQAWHATNRPVVAPMPPILGPWQVALRALESDADAALPTGPPGA